jgi:hypothetical protein
MYRRLTPKEARLFIVSPLDLKRFDVSRARQFVDFWSGFYTYNVTIAPTSKDPINYFSELNLQSDLTEQNLRRLLRWKDPRYLSDPMLTKAELVGREQNQKLQRALECLGELNKFRRDLVSEEEMRRTTDKVFPKGLVYQVFLFNIAKPYSYPIADQHVFRAFGVHKNFNFKPRVSWDEYMRYRSYFSEIAKALSLEEALHHVPELKKIDDALMVFGQFLKAYNSPQTSKSQN